MYKYRAKLTVLLLKIGSSFYPCLHKWTKDTLFNTTSPTQGNIKIWILSKNHRNAFVLFCRNLNCVLSPHFFSKRTFYTLVEMITKLKIPLQTFLVQMLTRQKEKKVWQKKTKKHLHICLLFPCSPRKNISKFIWMFNHKFQHFIFHGE